MRPLDRIAEPLCVDFPSHGAISQGPRCELRLPRPTARSMSGRQTYCGSGNGWVCCLDGRLGQSGAVRLIQVSAARRSGGYRCPDEDLHSPNRAPLCRVAGSVLHKAGPALWRGAAPVRAATGAPQPGGRRWVSFVIGVCSGRRLSGRGPGRTGTASSGWPKAASPMQASRRLASCGDTVQQKSPAWLMQISRADRALG